MNILDLNKKALVAGLVIGGMFSLGCNEQDQNYGGRTYTSAQSQVISTNDGGYMVSGSGEYSATAGGLSDCRIAKLKSDGTVSWGKSIGDDRLERNTRIVQTSDGGYILAAEFKSSADQRFNFLLVKFNSTGSVSWQKAYDYSDYDCINNILLASNGDIVIAGEARSDNSLSWVIRTNSTGDIVWQETVNLDYTDIKAAADGGLFFTGSTVMAGQGVKTVGYWDGVVTKMSASGTIEWTKSYGTTEKFVRGVSIEVASSGDIYVGGEYVSVSGANRDQFYGDFMVLKLNSSGDIVWQKAFGGSNDDRMSNMRLTSDGKLICAGYTSSYGADSKDKWVVELDTNGNILWQKAYSCNSIDFSSGIAFRHDEGFLVGGNFLLSIKNDGSVPIPGKSLKINNTSSQVYNLSLVVNSHMIPVQATTCSVFNPNILINAVSVTYTNL